jgi:tetratricopeptide (TPR) repeat protein
MSEKTFEYFEKKFIEAQNFAGENPAEITQNINKSREKVQEIIEEIQKIPENKREYDLSILLAKAFSFVNNIVDAMVVLVDLSVSDKERCQDDPLWNYYMGNCLFSHPKKPKYDTAYNYFVKFLEIAKGNKATEEVQFLIASAEALVKNIPMMIKK